MELNYNCVRDVMLFLEKQEHYVLNDQKRIIHKETRLNTIAESLLEYPENVIYYTLARLKEAGFINTTDHWGGNGLVICCVDYITYDGHEFLQKIKDDGIWGKTVAYAGKVGNFSLNMLGKIASEIAAIYVRKLVSGD